MNLPKLDLATCNDELRPMLSCIKITKKYTYASDAHIAVRHNSSELFPEDFIELLPEQGILLPRKSFQIMRKRETIGFKLSLDNKKIQLYQSDGSEIVYPLLDDANYPSVDHLIPEREKCTELKQIALNPKLLTTLSDALGSAGILHLWFYGEAKAILCDCNGNGDYFGAIGIIMPAMIEK